MAVPAWPVDQFPYAPDLNTVQPVTGFLDPVRTEMEGGNVRLRTRPGDNVGQVSYSIPMTKAQLDLFNAWVKTTLNNGTSRFSMPVWIDNAFLTKVCQFAAVPRRQRIGTSKLAAVISLRVYDL
ncbi:MULTISPECIES: hypothetical protein [unclassified Bradyrhizobium]